MKSHLEVLHKRIREMGGKAVKELFPEVHHVKLSTMASDGIPITAEMKRRMEEIWAADFVEDGDIPAEVEVVQPVLGANQLNFCILMAVRNNYDPSTVNSIVGLVRRTGCGWMQRPFDSMIERSRNILTKHFLATDYEWSFWMDDDMVIPNGEPNWFRKTLCYKGELKDEYAGLIAPYQLASWEKTIVSGVYYSRHGAENITAGFHKGTQLMNRLPHRSLLPVRYCGFGCVMIHRKVYEDISKKYPETAPSEANRNEGSWFSSLGNGEGEDEALCLRAQEAGHPTYLDLSVVGGHVGRKINYIPEKM